MDHRLPVLMGRRLLLREPTRSDGEHLFACLSDPEVTRFLAFDPPRSLEDTREFLGRVEAGRQQDREYVFLIASRSDDEPLGITSLRHIDLRLGTAQIGTCVRRSEWGTGVNTEAKTLLYDTVILDLTDEGIPLVRLEDPVSAVGLSVGSDRICAALTG